MKQNSPRTDQSSPGQIGRFPVILVASLFLVAALLSALPSVSEWSIWIHRQALAGFETLPETTRERPPILGEYYDTPSLPSTAIQTLPPSTPTLPQQTDF